MKVLLCEDVEKLGWLGDVVEVKAGYARNYLLPYGIAIMPNEANIRSLAEEKGKRAQERQLAREQLERLVSQVEGAEVVVAARANEQGHLFGSVTEHDIAENLRQQGFEISDKMVHMDEHIKQIGTVEVGLKIALDLSSNVSVVVVSEEQETEETEVE